MTYNVFDGTLNLAQRQLTSYDSLAASLWRGMKIIQLYPDDYLGD